jgi:uncharacterized protein (DUF58 family)
MIRPTRRAFFVAAAGLVLYLLAWRSVVGWFYVANAVVWAVLLLNLIAAVWNVRGLRVTRRLRAKATRDIFENDTVEIELEVSNAGLTPRFLFTMVELCPLSSPDREEKRFLVGAVPPRASVVARYSEQCYMRGKHSFGSVVLETSAPFGLFRARRRVRAPLDVLVYPEVFPSEGIRTPSVPADGRNLPSPARSTGEFRGAREYQSGDSMRAVHWRSSARHDELMVKEHDRSPETQVTVAFDATKSFGAGKETTLEYSIKLAASIARACFLQGAPFSMTPPGSRELTSWNAVLGYLALLRYGQAPALPDALSMGMSAGRLVAIVALADRESISALPRVPPSMVAAAVILRGFASDQERSADLDALEQAGIPLVICAPGDIPRTLESLGEVGRHATTVSLQALVRSANGTNR